MKGPSIEVSVLVVSAIITLAIWEWWHWVAVIAAMFCSTSSAGSKWPPNTRPGS
jgi:hypothetical protein